MPAALNASIALALLFGQIPAPTATPDHLRYQRAVNLPSAPQGASPQACATLDAEVFAHAAPDLKDLRLFNRDHAELPYATTLSEPLQQESEDARILNLGLRNGHIVFDLEMPHRPYTDVALTLSRKDFLATATVSGEPAPSGPQTRLGSFTLFDLTRQNLSHSTTLPLPESTFPYLHLELEVAAAPGSPSLPPDPTMVTSVSVPPSREAQTLYTTVQQIQQIRQPQQGNSFIQRNRQTVVTFNVPVRVPVERISFDLPPNYKGNFSRTVEIDAEASSEPTPSPDGATDTETQPMQPEKMTATILRVHTVEANHEIAHEELSVPVSIGSNMQRPAKIEVAIDNGDDAPLPLAAIRLEMRQRRICFDPPVSPLTLFYGDPSLQAPVYDFAKLFQPATTPSPAQLGPEQPNPTFHPRPESRPFTERHPELLWVVLLGVIAILAVVALRSARTLGQPTQP